jgi:hypothetical protein
MRVIFCTHDCGNFKYHTYVDILTCVKWRRPGVSETRSGYMAIGGKEMI